MTVLGRRELPPGKTDPLLLPHVDLREAGLIEANLEGADLRGANLEGARCNADTVLPTGFDCEAAEVKFQRS